MAPMQSLQDFADAGCDVRAWCFDCARGELFDSIDLVAYFRQRRWPLEIASARPRFRCRSCRRSDEILLVPASRPVHSIWVDRPLSLFRLGGVWSRGNQRRQVRDIFAK